MGSIASSAKRGRQKPRRRQALQPQSLLILHLDAEKLRGDGLHLGDVAEYSAMLSMGALGSSAAVADVTTLASLLKLFADFAEQKRTFDVIVAVGHSDAEGIQMASDRVASWEEFAAWVKPVRPRRLLLAACRAGRWGAGEALFAANDRLRRIFASPVNASKDFATMMLFAVPYVVAERRPRDKHVLWSQIAAVAVTGRQLREWRRVTDKGKPDRSVFDTIADLADPFARQVPGAIGTAIRSLFGW
jgi:hypothetical protein